MQLNPIKVDNQGHSRGLFEKPKFLLMILFEMCRCPHRLHCGRHALITALDDCVQFVGRTVRHIVSFHSYFSEEDLLCGEDLRCLYSCRNRFGGPSLKESTLTKRATMWTGAQLAIHPSVAAIAIGGIVPQEIPGGLRTSHVAGVQV